MKQSILRKSKILCNNCASEFICRSKKFFSSFNLKVNELYQCDKCKKIITDNVHLFLSPIP